MLYHSPYPGRKSGRVRRGGTCPSLPAPPSSAPSSHASLKCCFFSGGFSNLFLPQPNCLAKQQIWVPRDVPVPHHPAVAQPPHPPLHPPSPLGCGGAARDGECELLPRCRSTPRSLPPRGACPVGIAGAVPRAQGEAACPRAAKCFTGRLLASSICNEIVFIPGISIGGCSLLGRRPPPEHFGPWGGRPTPCKMFFARPCLQGLFGRRFLQEPFCKILFARPFLQDPFYKALFGRPFLQAPSARPSSQPPQPAAKCPGTAVTRSLRRWLLPRKHVGMLGPRDAEGTRSWGCFGLAVSSRLSPAACSGAHRLLLGWSVGFGGIILPFLLPAPHSSCSHRAAQPIRRDVGGFWHGFCGAGEEKPCSLWISP